MPRIILVVFVLQLLGCNTTDHNKVSEQLISENTSEASNTDGKDKVICSYERKTGSNFKTKVCRTLAQIELEKEEAQRAHGRALSGPMSGNTE